ncbi:MAG: hypothetical protein IJT25_03025 [Clostridia bacterium]|nr:hypothetical protein [Clostridia bacterium]
MVDDTLSQLRRAEDALNRSYERYEEIERKIAECNAQLSQYPAGSDEYAELMNRIFILKASKKNVGGQITALENKVSDISSELGLNK